MGVEDDAIRAGHGREDDAIRVGHGREDDAIRVGHGREDDAIRVVVVDDHPLLRQGIVHALSGQSDLRVVGEGADADAAVRLAAELMPDVLLLDVNMPGGGLDALDRIASSCPAIVVLVVSVNDDEETVAAALRMGARGYALKGINGRELIDTVRSLHRGERYVSPSLAASLLAQRKPNDRCRTAAERLRELTAREAQVLHHLAKGLSNKQIGAALTLSEKTIKHYVTNLLQKLQVSNRVAAALIGASNARPDEAD
jgi:two-component system, NarL family, nitrate/nitrite response regulator NarL